MKFSFIVVILAAFYIIFYDFKLYRNYIKTYFSDLKLHYILNIPFSFILSSIVGYGIVINYASILEQKSIIPSLFFVFGSIFNLFFVSYIKYVEMYNYDNKEKQDPFKILSSICKFLMILLLIMCFDVFGLTELSGYLYKKTHLPLNYIILSISAFCFIVSVLFLDTINFYLNKVVMFLIGSFLIYLFSNNQIVNMLTVTYNEYNLYNIVYTMFVAMFVTTQINDVFSYVSYVVVYNIQKKENDYEKRKLMYKSVSKILLFINTLAFLFVMTTSVFYKLRGTNYLHVLFKSNNAIVIFLIVFYIFFMMIGIMNLCRMSLRHFFTNRLYIVVSIFLVCVIQLVLIYLKVKLELFGILISLCFTVEQVLCIIALLNIVKKRGKLIKE